MTESEAIDKLNNLHYKIVHTSFCNKVYESEIEALCMAKDCLKEIQQYRAIGTIEEFKALKEKNKSKKAIFDSENEIYICSRCGKKVGEHQNYCWSCGQAFYT